MGVTIGRYWEWEHNKTELKVGQSIIDVGRKMIEAGKMADGAIQLHQDEELINDENGIVYLRIGFVKVPPAKLEEPDSLHPSPEVKKHDDIGDPEHDGQAPTEDADKWANDK